MSYFVGLARRVAALARRNRVEREMDDEIEFHLEMQTKELVEQGVDPEEARELARRSFGAVVKTKELCREEKGLPAAESVWRDIRYGIRKMVSMPVFTGAALLTLALGIGANTTVFSLINAVLLRPLPFPTPDRLVMIWENDRLRKTEREGFSLQDFQDLQEQATTFEAMAAYAQINCTITGQGEPERVPAARVTRDYFKTLGVRPVVGRLFTDEEYVTGRQKPALIGQELWKRRFASDPGIVGRAVILNGEHHLVVGVMPPELSHGLSPLQQEEVWVPLAATQDLIRGWHQFRVYARLGPGQMLDHAQIQVSGIMRRLEAAYPDDNQGRGAVLVQLQEQLTGSSRRSLQVLQAAVGLVFLIGCLNLANLMMARLASRRSEIAIRTTMGAGRLRVIRQFLTESLVLSVAGAALGLILAAVALRLCAGLGPEILPRLALVRLDGTALAFISLVCAATAVVFGLVPAVSISRGPLHEALKAAGRSLTEGRAIRTLRQSLVIVQVALTLVLLVAAGVLLKSFWKLSSTDPGYEPGNVLQVRLELPAARYPAPKTWPIYSWPLVSGVMDRVRERIDRLPGVEEASLSLHSPLMGGWTTRTTVVGRPAPPPGEQEEAEFSPVDTRYFTTLRIPVRLGRAFVETDDEKHPLVAVVNEEFVSRHFPGERPVGRQIMVFGVPREVVGVVGDVRLAGFSDPPKPTMYLPFRQNQMANFSILVRSAGDPMLLVPALRQEILAVDRDLALYDITRLDYGLEESLASQKVTAAVVGVVAGIALLLAALGIYGVISYSITRRLPEIGLRLAVGARESDIIRGEVGGMMLRVSAGMAAGVLTAVALGRFLSSLLHEVSPFDPAVLGAVLLVVFLLSLLACYIPVRRVLRMDPVTALRTD